MGRIIERKFGKLLSCVDKITGKRYEEMNEFYEKVGLIVIGISEKHPGKYFVFFYPKTNTDDQPYLHSDYGEYEETETKVVLKSSDCTWRFEIGDFGLSEMDKLFFDLDDHTWQINP